MVETRTEGVDACLPLRYETPELVVHGTVGELTRGQGGAIPDSASAGSLFT